MGSRSNIYSGLLNKYTGLSKAKTGSSMTVVIYNYMELELKRNTKTIVVHVKSVNIESIDNFYTINVSEVTDQRALHSSPNQLQVVLVMQKDEDVEMTVINSDDIIPLHNSNELDKQIVDHEEDDLWHVDPLLTHIQNSDIEASLWDSSYLKE
ncbi:hypothetical protein H5410_059598 [Solanum commersonii]|uniref:Uncharacterized protein n=1 Tax=Solanum commersonii TaxID=4109 RepID=A0A9J5W3F0_SOLCO|nr:hypothetical protein H5410_059598 [Solanum commersonii]